MPKGFIKCTIATVKRETAYFHAPHISAVMQAQGKDTNGNTVNYTVVYLDSAFDDCRFAVWETPEEVLQKIEEANS